MGERRLDLPDSFVEVVHRLRYWMAMHAIPGHDKLVVELHFPDARSQHYAAAELQREIGASYMLTSPRESRHIGPISPDRMEIEGLRIVFTNPERLDKR